MLSIQPISDLVYIDCEKNNNKTAAGLEVIEKQDNDTGIVVAVGPGKTYSNGHTQPPDVGVGDKVVFTKHVGQTTRIDGKTLLVMHDYDILAVVG